MYDKWVTDLVREKLTGSNNIQYIPRVTSSILNNNELFEQLEGIICDRVNDCISDIGMKDVLGNIGTDIVVCHATYTILYIEEYKVCCRDTSKTGKDALCFLELITVISALKLKLELSNKLADSFLYIIRARGTQFDALVLDDSDVSRRCWVLSKGNTDDQRVKEFLTGALTKSGFVTRGDAWDYIKGLSVNFNMTDLATVK